jgi:hypothetical protein
MVATRGRRIAWSVCVALVVALAASVWVVAAGGAKTKPLPVPIGDIVGIWDVEWSYRLHDIATGEAHDLKQTGVWYFTQIDTDAIEIMGFTNAHYANGFLLFAYADDPNLPHNSLTAFLKIVKNDDTGKPGLLKGTGNFVLFHYYGYDGYPSALSDKSEGEGEIEHGTIIAKQRSHYLPE